MSSPERTLPAREAVVLELALVLVAAWLGARLLLRDWGSRPFLWNEWLASGHGLLFLLFVLVGARALLNERTPPWTRSGLRPGRWLTSLRVPEWIVASAFLFALSVAQHPGPSPGGDARPLLAQLRGLFFDGRLVVDPLYEPGPALVWLPFYAVAHLLVMAGFSHVPADGWSAPYLNAVRLGSLVSALAAGLIALRVARRYFPARLAACAVALAWLGSPLLYYTTAAPAMPHAPATLGVALFLLLWVRARERPERTGRWIALAAAGGALLSMQRYEVFYLVAPLFDVVRLVRRRVVALSALALILALVPLLWLGWGRGSAWPWEGGLLAFNLRYWSEPRVAELLFSSRGGFLAWTPVAGLALLGLVVFARRQPAFGGGLLLALAVGLWLLGSNWAWAASWAFGGRRLTEFAPVLALGLAAALEILWRRPALPLVALAALLVAWNLSLVGLVQRGAVPQDATFSFGDAAGLAARDAHAALGNPAAFPAPWLYAARHDVAPGRFDELFGRDARREWFARLGGEGDGQILGSGWSAPAPGGGRAPLGRRATLLVVLAEPRPCELRLATLAESAGLSAGVEVNGARAASVVVPGLARASVPALFWHAGTNEIALVADTSPPAYRLERFELACGGTP